MKLCTVDLLGPRISIRPNAAAGVNSSKRQAALSFPSPLTINTVQPSRLSYVRGRWLYLPPHYIWLFHGPTCPSFTCNGRATEGGELGGLKVALSNVRQRVRLHERYHMEEARSCLTQQGHQGRKYLTDLRYFRVLMRRSQR